MICSPEGFLMTYPSNTFSCPPCRLPYTLTFSFNETFSLLLSGKCALTKMDPELSVRVKPLSVSWVIVPSIVVTGGNTNSLIGATPAQPPNNRTAPIAIARTSILILISSSSTKGLGADNLRAAKGKYLPIPPMKLPRGRSSGGGLHRRSMGPKNRQGTPWLTSMTP